MKPIFIFSLPRSGSTLLQRILMGHPEIKSASEPWILLPHVYALRKDGIVSEYAHLRSYRGLKDFVRQLPNKEQDYYDELRNFIDGVYSKYCFNNEKYFLDKTPRYYMIIEEIYKMFPDAKFIFLFRHPMQIINSMVNTWGEGRFKSFYSVEDDIVKGIEKLRLGSEQLIDKALFVHYENLVLNSEKEIIEVFKYLDLNIENNEIITNLISKATLKGRMGDKKGLENYKEINRETLVKWKDHFNTFFRVWLAKYYLRKIGGRNLKYIGYDMQSLMVEIDNLPKKVFYKDIVDIIDFLRVRLVKKFHLNLFFGNETKSRINNKYLI